MRSDAKIEGTERADSMLDEFDFKKLLFKIIHNKWPIMAVTLLTLGVGILYTFSIHPKYVASALIQVDSQLGSANSMQQMLGNMNSAFTPAGQASPADIEIALIKSRFILQSVIDNLRLSVVVSPRYLPIVGAGVAHFFQHHQLNKPLFGLSHFAWGGEQIHLGQFEIQGQNQGTHLRLRADTNNTYRVYGPNKRLLLAGIVGEFAESKKGVLPHVKMRLTKLIANPGTYFNISIKHSDDVLKQLLHGLSIVDLGNTYKTKTGVLQLSYQGHDAELIPKILNSIVDYAIQKNVEKKSAEASKTLDFLNRQLPNVRTSLEMAETDLNEYRAKSGTIDISQEGRIILMQLSAIEQNIAELKLKKVEMLQELTPKHPFILALSEKQMQLQKEVYSLEKKIKTLPITDQRALSLERDVKVKNQLYLLLLNKIQQLQVLKAGTLSDIRILYQATTPLMPQPTHKSFTLMVSLLLGLVLGTLMVFLRDLLRRGINDTQVVEERLGIPTFAMIPCSTKQKQCNRRHDGGSAHVLAQLAPKDLAIEGIRSLRTMLEFTLKQGSNNIITILGASPNIGKSFVSINLSQVLVDSGKRVLLIDCDLRKGKIGEYLGKHQAPGFAELLASSCPVANVITTISNGFDYIASGEYPKNPSELLMQTRLHDLLHAFSQQYDMVIIDTPPILAVTDGIILAKFAGINLMVIGASSDQLEELELMVKRVKRNGIKIDGLVFNNKSQTQVLAGQYRYYYAYEN